MFRTASTRINTLAVALLVALGLALASGAPGSPLASADASTVQGTVRWYSGVAAGANNLTLQRWNGSAWANVVSGKSNTNGYFAFTLQPGGYYYRVYAARSVGQCLVGIGIDYYQGWSDYVYTPSNTVATTDPYVYRFNHVSC
jgi:hypothetical protein